VKDDTGKGRVALSSRELRKGWEELFYIFFRFEKAKDVLENMHWDGVVVAFTTGASIGSFAAGSVNTKTFIVSDEQPPQHEYE
jgi:hypothetical protein